MFETIVAIQSIANIRYRNATSGDAPVERFSTATTQALLAAARGDLYWERGPGILVKVLTNGKVTADGLQRRAGRISLIRDFRYVPYITTDARYAAFGGIDA
jgi:hypothetical protein